LEAQKSEGRLRFRKRPSWFDGDKPNSVGVIAHADDHSSHPDLSECPANFHSPWCDDTRGFLSGRLPFLCFVLHRMGFFVPRELLRER
jgi:hypothetical protein